MRIKTLMLGTLLAAAAADPSFAYSYRTCNGTALKLPGNNHTVRYSTNSFPAGYWLNGLQNSINQYNKNPSNFFYSLAADTNGLGRGNGESEVWGSTDQGILQGAPAIAYSYWDCYWLFGWHIGMKEGDVIFDYTSTAANPFEWTATQSKTALFNYTGSGRLLQGTAVHEFGHAAGLLHVNTEYNVMGSDFSHVHTNSSTTNAYIGEDAGDGMVFLYGLWAGGPNDLGVAHWRYTGASGEYSTHGKTRIFNSVGAVQPSFTVNGEAGFVVNRGQTIRAEFTYENNGRAAVNGVPISYYISTNDWITTADRVIGSQTMNLSRGNVLTWNKTLVIPANLTANTNYWLGVIVDPAGTIAESDRSNNATYIPIRVQ